MIIINGQKYSDKISNIPYEPLEVIVAEKLNFEIQ